MISQLIVAAAVPTVEIENVLPVNPAGPVTAE
jgi:hypothetical protein